MLKVEKLQNIRKIGNSQGIHITARNDVFEKALTLAEVGVKKYHRAFRELAK